MRDVLTPDCGAARLHPGYKSWLQSLLGTKSQLCISKWPKVPLHEVDGWLKASHSGIARS